VNTKACEACSNFDPVLHKCKDIINYNLTNVAAGGNKVILPVNSTIDNYQPKKGDLICPTDRPFFDGVKCIDCLSAFDISKKICVTCVNFDIMLHICKDIPNYNTSNFDAGNSKYLLPAGANISDYKPKAADLICPIASPFYNGSACINCP
jgi:hypothetical protein